MCTGSIDGFHDTGVGSAGMLKCQEEEHTLGQLQNPPVWLGASAEAQQCQRACVQLPACISQEARWTPSISVVPCWCASLTSANRMVPIPLQDELMRET